MASSTRLLTPHILPLLWLAVTLAPLLLVERWIHRHLQGVMLLFTGDIEIAVVLYALPLLPGILLHELSHALAAILMGVRVGRISIRPKRTGQRIQLGFVPIEKTDVVRASLIGLAPLLVGSGVILLIGYWVFDIGTVGVALVTGDQTDMIAGLLRALKAPDAWIWAYVIFAVSNTMLPSRADRQAWTPLILFLLLIGAVVWAAGLGPAVIESLSELLTKALHWLATMCALTIAIDLPFALLIALMEKVLEQAKSVQVEY
ncbi:MAG: M50 family metallopeptidase [Chloroflexota bacterium]|nr:M50 family metallopeptidase [Chloroflexota bacterium]